MNRHVAQRVSISYFIAAVLLLLFGVADLHAGDTASATSNAVSGPVQIGLGVLMGAAGLYLRTATAEARTVAIVAAALTVAVGAYALFGGHTYMAGSIIAIASLIRLLGAGTDPTAPPRPGSPTARSPFDPPPTPTEPPSPDERRS